MTKYACVVLVILCGLTACQTTGTSEWHQGDATGLAMTCIPKGPPPFPAVVYSHGIIVEQKGVEAAAARGYDMKGLCRAFADSGFLVFMPIRRGTFQEQVAELQRAVAAVKARPDVDPRRVSMVGMSRGGLLTLLAATLRQPVQSYVLMAPAPGQRGKFQKAARKARKINAPVLVMVELSDDVNILDDVDSVEDALRAAGKPHKVIRYDRGGGHLLFGTAGYYWPDLIKFLRDPRGAVGAS